jgi:hypothetical protein
MKNPRPFLKKKKRESASKSVEIANTISNHSVIWQHIEISTKKNFGPEGSGFGLPIEDPAHGEEPAFSGLS